MVLFGLLGTVGPLKVLKKKFADLFDRALGLPAQGITTPGILRSRLGGPLHHSIELSDRSLRRRSDAGDHYGTDAGVALCTSEAAAALVT
jgi:hypothetical protein